MPLNQFGMQKGATALYTLSVAWLEVIWYIDQSNAHETLAPRLLNLSLSDCTVIEVVDNG